MNKNILIIASRAIPLFFILISAAYSKDEKIYEFTPCEGNASFCAPAIMFNGKIEEGDEYKLINFIKNSNKNYKYVYFNSPGGSLKEALAIGGGIRILGMNTWVASKYTDYRYVNGERTKFVMNNVVCASACAYAFLGGVLRTVEDGSVIGLHQFSSASPDVSISDAQKIISELNSYVISMGVDRTIVDYASNVENKDLYWLSVSEAKRFNIDNTSPKLSAWALESTENGGVFASVYQMRIGQAGASFLSLFPSGDRDSVALVVGFVPYAANDLSAEEVGNLIAQNSKEITISSGFTNIFTGKSVRGWKTILKSNPNHIRVYSIVIVPNKAFRRMLEQSSVHISFNIPQIYNDYDPSQEFDLVSLRPLVKAVLKSEL